MGLDQQTAQLFAAVWLEASASAVPDARDAQRIGAALFSTLDGASRDASRPGARHAARDGQARPTDRRAGEREADRKPWGMVPGSSSIH